MSIFDYGSDGIRDSIYDVMVELGAVCGPIRHLFIDQSILLKKFEDGNFSDSYWHFDGQGETWFSEYPQWDTTHRIFFEDGKFQIQEFNS